MKTSKNTFQNSQNVMKAASLAMLIFSSACGKTSVPQSQTPSPAVKPTATADNAPTGTNGNPVVLRDGGSSGSSSGGSRSSSGAASSTSTTTSTTTSASPSANPASGTSATTGKGQNTMVDASATHAEFTGSFAWNLPSAVVGDAKLLQNIDNSTAEVIEKGQAQTQEQAQQDVAKDKSGLFCQTEGFAALTTGDTLQMLAMNSRSSALGEDWSDVTVDYQTPAGHKVKLDCKVMGQPSDDLVAATFLKALNFAGRNDQLLMDLVGASPAIDASKAADPAASAKTGEAAKPEISAAAKLASAQFQKMQILKPQVLAKMESDIKKLDPKNDASVAQTPTLALGQIVTMKKAGEMLASAGGPKAVCTLEGIKGHLRTNAVYQAQKPIVDDVSDDSKIAELVFPFATATKEAVAFRCLLISGGSLEDVMGALKGTVKFVGSLPKP